MKASIYLVVGILLAGLLLPACAPQAEQEPEELVFGMVLVGPKNDRGWSQAHYEAGQ